MISAVGRSPEQVVQSRPDVQKCRLKEACQEFESFLNGYIFKSMRESIVKTEEPDQAGQIYESMMDETLAKELSRSGSGGLADMLYRQLLPLIQTASEEKQQSGARTEVVTGREGIGSDEPESASSLLPGTSGSDRPVYEPLPQREAGSED